VVIEGWGMNEYVTDTHALFWYLTASPRLGEKAKNAFDEGAQGQATIYIPAIVLAELYFLNEKLGRPLNYRDEFERLHQSSQLEFVPFLPEDILEFDGFSDPRDA
jgi:predicted nucleic acid-binding protein